MKKSISFLILVIGILFFLLNVPTEQKEVVLVGKLVAINTDIKIKEDRNSNTRRVKTSTKNVGIITCVNLETNEFVSLGHPIELNNKSNEESEKIEGTCYEAKYLSVNRPISGVAGSIKANANNAEQYGIVTKNTTCGIYGNVSNFAVEEKNKVKVASKFEIRLGKAEILIDLDGKGIKNYDVNVAGIDYLDENQNINIKVTDKELIDLTGGIVRGMSGAPIVQNGKLIGVVNYVSEANPLDGFAVFSDKLF